MTHRTINIKGKTYNKAYIPDYLLLISKLMSILSRNKTMSKFKYHGIKMDNKRGILVEGTDSTGVTEFAKFFPINDIHHYFDKT